QRQDRRGEVQAATASATGLACFIFRFLRRPLIEERREDAEREAAERQELEAKRQQAIEYIISLGLDPESLLAPVTADTVKTRRKAKGGVRKAKYRFKDENGEIREWSGNGKRPLALQKLLDEGHFMEDFLIEKTKPEQAE
ncbi:H-NS family nucleoid-associated regulatory protein, partial [Salmonella enterica]|uniref:H-NS family nucleoid-associated regulatory protein n=1 Tax=Salmonella enterica TaxID=28901 RepID=UPI000AA49B1F